MTTTAIPARWYPNQPPMLDGETPDEYTNRLLGAGGHAYPYDHRRGRQCSIGWHAECSQRYGLQTLARLTDDGIRFEHLTFGEGCECPHHAETADAARLVREWNDRFPVGTMVSFPDDSSEPTVRTTGPAEVVHRNRLDWPAVPLEGFDHPVQMSWLEIVR